MAATSNREIRADPEAPPRTFWWTSARPAPRAYAPIHEVARPSAWACRGRHALAGGLAAAVLLAVAAAAAPRFRGAAAPRGRWAADGGVALAVEHKEELKQPGAAAASAAHSPQEGSEQHVSSTAFLSTEPARQAPKNDGGGSPWDLASAAVHSVEGALDKAAVALKLKTETTTTTQTTTNTLTGTTTTVTTTTQTTTKTTTTATTTTATTTTITTTSTRLATLFCFAVVRVVGYEAGLMGALQQRQASIFGCDEHKVYSNGGVTWVGPHQTQEIPAPPVQMGNMSEAGTTTRSWLNTLIFMEAWKLVLADGRWWGHEWTVKVDPDAVFFPDRLRVALYPYYTAGDKNGPALFVANCDLTWGGPPELKIYGSLEVFSRGAVGMYNANQDRCKHELPWHKWGEDLFMEQCLKKLNVGVVNGVSFLADKRCHPAACSDTTKVAFHAFKDIGSWLNCWHQSQPQPAMFFKK